MAQYLILLVALVASVSAFPPGPPPPGGPGFPPMGPPPPPRELPPGLADILPAATVEQLKAVHESDSLSPIEKHEQIDQILVNLPEDIADKLPKPPGFERLPQDVKDQLKNIHRDKSLNWQTRMDKIREYLTSLPEETRRLLPPMGPPPPQQHRGFGQF